MRSSNQVNRRLQACLAILLCGVAIPLNVTAQETEEPGESGMVLEEVIVTAQKRDERLIDVPISITAFTNTMMVDTGAAQLADFLQTAPGVSIVDSQSGTQNIQIRGINSTYGNALVGYYLDELPFTLVGNTQVPDVRTYDLERIEVLRGPQGTLYGDGSIGGTIRILTRDPDLAEFTGDGDLTGSSTSDGDSNWAAKGMLNLVLKEDVAGLRLVASEEQYGGWIDNTVSGVEDQNERDISNFRGKFRWVPTERLDIILSAWHTEEEALGDALALDDGTTTDPVPEYDTEYDLYGATIRYSFESFELVSASSWMDYTGDSVTWIAGLFEFTDLTDQDIFSQEVRLASNGSGSFRWTTGLFYREMDRHTVALLPAFAITQDLNLKSDSYAVFGEGTWTILDDKLDLTMGLRYYEDDRLYQEDVDPFLLDLIQSIDPTFTGTVDETFDNTSPRFNAAYRFSDDWNVYANVAEGFRTGQPQPALSLGLAALFGVDIPSGIEPETMWSYELGTKGLFLDGRAMFEAALFYNDWEDLQVPVLVTQQVRALVNGGTAVTQGIEVGATVSPLEGLSLQFAGSYTDAEFTESVAGININDGDQIPNVPEILLSATSTYRWRFSNALGGFIYGGIQYASERTDTLNFATDSASTTRLDVRLGVEAEVWSAFVFIDNLTNEDGALAPYYFGPAGPATRMRPQTVGLQLRAWF
ncbi:MAG: TonB-dependent receptor [Lysobacterales bacterium]|nr:MAG: TonB-dependent receptor [Xanthomonadales bacterium]